MRNIFASFFIFFTVATVFSIDIKQVVRVKNNEYYAVTENHGLQHSVNRGKTWFSRNHGLEHKVVWPFTNTEIRDLTSLTINSANPDLITLTMAQSLYQTTDKGFNWRKINLKHPITASYYLTASANHPLKSRFFLLGTSCNGLFFSDNDGISWRNINTIRSHFYHGVEYYKEITSIAILTEGLAKETIFLLSNDGNQIIFSDLSMEKWEVFEHDIEDSLYSLSVNRNCLEVYSKTHLYSYDFTTEKWKEAVDLNFISEAEFEADKINRLDLAKDKKGFYIRWDNAIPSKIDSWIDFCKKNDFNSVVIDFKNDHGQLTYDSQLEYAKQIDAINNKIDAKLLIQKFHENDIYIIARMVVFKDRMLFNAENNKYATINRNTGKPWGHFLKETTEDGTEYLIQREFWVDPYSDFVWDYNISIAKELEALGIDEIQFDYIRFPSDGDVHLADYSHRKTGMSKIDALESFMRKARNDLSLPIGVDLYGFNSFYRLGNWIGQNIELMSKYVDVVSPMFYPSHFPRGFIYNRDFNLWAKDIYYQGSNRAAIMTSGHCVIRPYVQAFLLTSSELAMNKPEYTDYLRYQLEGNKESLASGFTLWNNSNIYYMVNFPMTNY